MLAILSVVSLARAQFATPSITGSRVNCMNNSAAGHACQGIDLLARLSMNDLDVYSTLVNDIWGWTDPDTQREYALVGTNRSVAFVDVTDPVNPVPLGVLPGRTGEFIWRDMKVYKDHMFVTVDGYGNGVQVFDLRQLRNPPGARKDFIESAHYNGISKAHNIAINEETGFAYIVGYSLTLIGQVGDTCQGQGLHILNIQDPANPVYAGCFADHSTGFNGTGYTHDVQCLIYRGPDIKYQEREICIGSNATHISIADVTDKKNPIRISSATYPHVTYSHQGWLTADQRYFFMNDEHDELRSPSVSQTRTIIWDMGSLEDPIYHSEFSFPTESVDHNLYIHGDYMFAANYSSGLRIVDISDISSPREIAFFDTHPNADDLSFNGAWSSFRFPGSGVTIVSSDPEGLLVLDPVSVTITTHAEASLEIPETFSLSPAYPNPFNPLTSTTLTLPQNADIRVEVLDVLGRQVDLLHDGLLPIGEHTFTFDATQLPSGNYYIRAHSDQSTTGTRVSLIK